MRIQEQYTTDVEYPSIFIRNQTPILMSAVAVLNGFNHHFPATEFAYCDFGCGNGLTLCLLAACNPQGSFFGVDINSSHIEKAKKLAEHAGLENITFIETEFDSLGEADLPPLDYAAVAGILSWLHDETRTRLLKYISIKLKTGGLCYLHYQSMPGASKTLATTMVTQLLADQYEGESSTRAVSAVTEVQKLFEGEGILPFNKMLPQVRETLSRQLMMDPNYLTHDILNRNTKPIWFHQVQRELSPNGLKYVGHAQAKLNAIDALYPTAISEPYRKFCEGHKDVTLREEVAGLLLNLPIRMDIFGKNLQKIDRDQSSNFRGLFLYDLSDSQSETVQKTKGDAFSVDFSDQIYEQILETANTHNGDVEVIIANCHREFGLEKMRQAIMHLVGTNKIVLGQKERPIKGDTHSWAPSKMDEFLLTSFLAQRDGAPIPSKAIGGCVDIAQLDRVLLALLVTKNPQLIWSLISRHGIKIRTLNGIPITDYTTFTQVLPGILNGFKQQRLPKLMRLGVLSS